MLVILTQPALTVIDHGHFQYNSVSLGFSLWGMVAVIADWDIFGSIAFCLALNYKQMELYHSLPFFCYLLGKAYICGKATNDGNAWIIRVLKLSLAVISTFAMCWSPFYIFSGRQGIVQVLRRVFPLNRGIYEDKVANFWCSISVLIKIRNFLSTNVLVWLSLLITLLAALPSLWNLLKNPTPYRFLLSLVSDRTFKLL